MPTKSQNIGMEDDCSKQVVEDTRYYIEDEAITTFVGHVIKQKDAKTIIEEQGLIGFAGQRISSIVRSILNKPEPLPEEEPFSRQRCRNGFKSSNTSGKSY